MAPDPNNVIVGGSGAVYVAPEGTALPTTLAAVAAPFTDLGYTSEDGVTFTLSRDSDTIDAWQASEPVRELVTAEPKSIEFELIEFGNPAAVKLALRGGTIVVAAGVATLTPPAAGATDVRALVFDVNDGGYHFRFCFARVALSDDVELQFQKADATRLPLTFGVQAGGWYVVTDHPKWVAAPGLDYADTPAGELVDTIGPATEQATLEQLATDTRSTVKKAAEKELARRAELASTGA